MRNLLLFLPQEFLVLMLAIAGIAMIVGARQLAMSLIGGVAMIVFLPVLLAPFFDALPGWLLVGLLVFFGLSLVRTLFEMLIGKRSTDHMVGDLAADVVRAGFLAPFRLLGWLIRTIFGRR